MQQPAIRKILILAHDHRRCFTRVFSENAVIHRLHANLDDMNGLMPLRGNPPRQRRGQLGINEEVQAGCSTA